MPLHNLAANTFQWFDTLLRQVPVECRQSLSRVTRGRGTPACRSAAIADQRLPRATVWQSLEFAQGILVCSVPFRPLNVHPEFRPGDNFLLGHRKVTHDCGKSGRRADSDIGRVPSFLRDAFVKRCNVRMRRLISFRSECGHFSSGPQRIHCSGGHEVDSAFGAEHVNVLVSIRHLPWMKDTLSEGHLDAIRVVIR